MSIQAVAWVLEHSDARLSDRNVLIVLADEAASDGGSCHPSLRRIAKHARVHTDTANECIKSLEAAAETLVLRPAKPAPGRVNRYLLLMGRTAAEAIADLDPTDPDLADWQAMYGSSAQSESGTARDCAEPRGTTRADPLTHRPKEKRSREPNPLWDSLVEVFGDSGADTRRGMYGRTVKELKEMGATPEQVLERGKRLLAKGWNDPTPIALVKHWPALAPPKRASDSDEAYNRALLRALREGRSPGADAHERAMELIHAP